MTKQQFDLDRSHRECPPDIYYSQLGTDRKPLFPGITFKKRVVLNRNLVTFAISEQIREEDSGEERVDTLEGSYASVGQLYNEPPQAIIEDPDDPKRFKGTVGFGRDAAQENLGWETAIYDIVEYDTKLSLEAFKINSNDDESHTPAFPNTKTTIQKSVINAVNAQLIEDDDDAILEYLKMICRSKPKWHQPILDTIRKEHISRWPTMKAFSTARAKKLAIKLGMPYEGNKNKKVTSLGYFRKWTAKKNIFWDAMVLSTKYGWQKVFVSTWVTEPNPKSLKIDRQAILEDFDKMEKDFQIWISHYLDMPIHEVRERGKGRFPIIFNGFSGQDKEENPKQGGDPIEGDLVGVNGKSWKRLDV